MTKIFSAADLTKYRALISLGVSPKSSVFICVMECKLETDEVLLADGSLESMAYSPNGGGDSGRPRFDGPHLPWSPKSHLGLLEMLVSPDFNMHISSQ